MSQQIELVDCSDLKEYYQESEELSQLKEGYFCFNKSKQQGEKDIYPQIEQNLMCRNNINIIIVKRNNLDNYILQDIQQNSALGLSIPTTLIDNANIQNPFQNANIMKQFDTSQFFTSQLQQIQQKLMIQITLSAISIEDQRNYSIQENRDLQSFTIQSVSDKVNYFLKNILYYQSLQIQLINRALDSNDLKQLKNNVDETDILFKVKIGFSELNYNKKYIRQFQSIPSILGSLGGGIKIVVLMGFLIVSPLSSIHFQKTMLNEVFNFENDQDDDSLQYNRNNLHSLKSIEGLQTHNKNHTGNNNTNNSQHQDQTKKQSGSKGFLKINFSENQNVMHTSSPQYRQPLKNVNNFSQGTNGNQKKEIIPTSTKSVVIPKSIQNIEKQKQNKSAQNNKLTNHLPYQNSLIFSKQSQQPESNFEELNFTQLSQLKGGERKNKMKEIIKGTILINSQRQIDSQQNLEINSPMPKLPQRLSFVSNAQSQNTNALNKKKQNDQKKAEEQIFEKYFKTTFNPLKISFLQSLFYYIWPFGKFKRTKEQMSYSIDKLNYHLDSIYIIKKLLEIDKLKILLLDENQIKLFEFLPKPTINLKKVENQQQSFQDSSCLVSEDDQKKINVLYQDTRNELTKATQAFQAFQTIKSKPTLTQIDRKLIDLLDPKIADYFNQDDDDNKSQMIPLNQMSQENENNHPINFFEKDLTHKNQLYSLPENTPTNSQNFIKDSYQKNKGSSGYISSPFEIYRSAAKKASMFKQPQLAIKRGSLNVSPQSNKYDEEVDLENNNLKIYNQGEQQAQTRLARLKSHSSEDIQSKLKRSKDHTISSSQSKEGSGFYYGVKNISAQQPKSLEMQKIMLENSHFEYDKINGDMEESLYKGEQERRSSGLKQKFDISNHTNNVLSNSVLSDASHYIIADESIKLQNIDCQNLQKFTQQNKFSKSFNYSTLSQMIHKQIENQTEQIFSSKNQSDLQEKKSSLNEENKLVSQYEIQINLQKKINSQENVN